MRYPVCVSCGREMQKVESGVAFVEMFTITDRDPYKIWNADLFECPGCYHQIISHFADSPLREHFQADFKDVLRHLERPVIEFTPGRREPK